MEDDELNYDDEGYLIDTDGEPIFCVVSMCDWRASYMQGTAAFCAQCHEAWEMGYNSCHAELAK